MTPAEFAYLIEFHHVSLEWAIDWHARRDVRGAEVRAHGRTSIEAMERLAYRAGWLTAGPLPLFDGQGNRQEED